MSVRVELPASLARFTGGVTRLELALGAPVTASAILDGVEAAFPDLRGLLREHRSGRRRPFIRFFGCQQDLSHEPAGAEVPAAVAEGREAFVIIGAIAGG